MSFCPFAQCPPTLQENTIVEGVLVVEGIVYEMGDVDPRFVAPLKSQLSAAPVEAIKKTSWLPDHSNSIFAPGEASIVSRRGEVGITQSSVWRASAAFRVAKPSMLKASLWHLEALQSESLDGFGHVSREGQSSQWIFAHHAVGIARM